MNEGEWRIRSLMITARSVKVHRGRHTWFAPDFGPIVYCQWFA